MQVFLPYESYSDSVSVLDPKRLGNQIYRECLTILRSGLPTTTIILNQPVTLPPREAWGHHPAVKMWKNYKHQLRLYMLAGLDELTKRGQYYAHHYDYLHSLDLPYCDPPPFIGNRPFHLSHQSNLLRKNYKWYHRYFGEIPTDLPYIWPEQ